MPISLRSNSTKANLCLGFLIGCLAGLASTYLMERIRGGEFLGLFTILYGISEFLVAAGVLTFLCFSRLNESYLSPRFWFGIGIMFSMIYPPFCILLAYSAYGRGDVLIFWYFTLVPIVTAATLLFVKRTVFFGRFDFVKISISFIFPMHCIWLWWGY